LFGFCLGVLWVSADRDLYQGTNLRSHDEYVLHNTNN
jgi:hypothetical protein